MIFYLHGLGGSAADWQETATSLPGKALSIPDLPLTDCVHSLCSSFTGEALCGYSMGGRLALLMAQELRKQSRVPRFLILVSSGLGFETEKERAERRKNDEAWARLAGENLGLFWEKWYAQPLFQSIRQLPEKRIASWMKNREPLNINSLQSQFRNLGPAEHPHLKPLLLSLMTEGVKVLYIAGEQDKKYTELARELSSAGVLTKILPGAGHALPLERPRELAAIIADFLERT